MEFEFRALPGRVVFGTGSVQHLAREIEGIGAHRSLVIATTGQKALADRLCARIGRRSIGVLSSAVMHVPIDVVQRARLHARETQADCLVAVGGGSSIGLAKAVALESGLPILAVPTTYAGSEMTPIYGITADGQKKTGRDLRVLPRVVIYDPELSAALPIGITVASGINAIAHAAEGLYAKDGNPVTSLLAEEGIRALAGALPRLYSDASDLDARSDALYGAWLSGHVLGSVGMALHHKVCHVLGGTFALPHAEVHAVVLPHAFSFNSDAAPDACSRVARALRCTPGVSAAAALFDLARNQGVPTSLKALGMRVEDLDQAASLACGSPYWNPRTASWDDIRELLQHAYDGRRPS